MSESAMLLPSEQAENRRQEALLFRRRKDRERLEEANAVLHSRVGMRSRHGEMRPFFEKSSLVRVNG